MTRTVALIAIGLTIGWLVGILDAASVQTTISVLSAAILLGGSLVALPKLKAALAANEATAINPLPLALVLIGLAAGTTAGLVARKRWKVFEPHSCATKPDPNPTGQASSSASEQMPVVPNARDDDHQGR